MDDDGFKKPLLPISKPAKKQAPKPPINEQPKEEPKPEDSASNAMNVEESASKPNTEAPKPKEKPEKPAPLSSSTKKLESKYQPPNDAAVPKEQYYFEVLKNGIVLERIDLKDKDHFIFGRTKEVVDIHCEHPSTSRQHAVLQYRGSPENGQFHIFDLGSTHGTFLNKRQIKSNVYVPCKPGSVLKFGQSSRLFALNCPTLESQEAEALESEAVEKAAEKRAKEREAVSNMSYMQKVQKRARELERLSKSKAGGGGGGGGGSGGPDDGCSWGFGEDAIEEEDTENKSESDSDEESSKRKRREEDDSSDDDEFYDRTRASLAKREKKARLEAASTGAIAGSAANGGDVLARNEIETEDSLRDRRFALIKELANAKEQVDSYDARVAKAREEAAAAAAKAASGDDSLDSFMENILQADTKKESRHSLVTRIGDMEKEVLRCEKLLKIVNPSLYGKMETAVPQPYQGAIAEGTSAPLPSALKAGLAQREKALKAANAPLTIIQREDGTEMIDLDAPPPPPKAPELTPAEEARMMDEQAEEEQALPSATTATATKPVVMHIRPTAPQKKESSKTKQSGGNSTTTGGKLSFSLGGARVVHSSFAVKKDDSKDAEGRRPLLTLDMLPDLVPIPLASDTSSSEQAKPKLTGWGLNKVEDEQSEQQQLPPPPPAVERENQMDVTDEPPQQSSEQVVEGKEPESMPAPPPPPPQPTTATATAVKSRPKAAEASEDMFVAPAPKIKKAPSSPPPPRSESSAPAPTDDFAKPMALKAGGKEKKGKAAATAATAKKDEKWWEFQEEGDQTDVDGQWAPPSGQTGDGKTSLNAKFGY